MCVAFFISWLILGMIAYTIFARLESFRVDEGTAWLCLGTGPVMFVLAVSVLIMENVGNPLRFLNPKKNEQKYIINHLSFMCCTFFWVHRSLRDRRIWHSDKHRLQTK